MSVAMRRARLMLAMTVSVMSMMPIAGCVSEPPRSAPKSTAATYTVRAGDTLYSIAFRHGLDYRELARLNGIGRDYAISPGQVLRLRAGANVAQSKSKSPPKTTDTRPKVSAPSGPPVDWAWPVRGKATLTTRPNGGQGLTIEGESGQEIRAAGSGRAVYVGSGMLGYGQLIIIKHNDTYLSAYGHTQALRVREGEQVTKGQLIATMGAGPSGSPMLYFEIRANGDPVDPTALLPK